MCRATGEIRTTQNVPSTQSVQRSQPDASKKERNDGRVAGQQRVRCEHS